MRPHGGTTFLTRHIGGIPPIIFSGRRVNDVYQYAPLQSHYRKSNAFQLVDQVPKTSCLKFRCGGRRLMRFGAFYQPLR